MISPEIQSQTIISKIMAVNYSIPDQKSNPKCEFDYIQIHRRLEAFRNQIHWSENILISLNTVGLEFLLNRMSIGYQHSK